MSLYTSYQIKCDACGLVASVPKETWSKALQEAERAGWRKVKPACDFNPTWDLCPDCFPMNMVWRPRLDLVAKEHQIVSCR